MELWPRLQLLLGGGGGEALRGSSWRGLDEELLSLQVEGAAHALAEAEGGGRVWVTIYRAGIEAVPQVSGELYTLRLGPGSAPHGLECEARR
jgi:hypothetical protein